MESINNLFEILIIFCNIDHILVRQIVMHRYFVEYPFLFEECQLLYPGCFFSNSLTFTL